jgi:hypothetical protein
VEKQYKCLALVRWGNSFQSYVGEDYRSVARYALETFPLPKATRKELTELVFAELDKPVAYVDFTKPFTVPFYGETTASLALDLIEVVP